MKYCPSCGYENLNEMFFCRHCNYEFPDFDWDTVEHDNIMIVPMMSKNRIIERYKFFKRMDSSFVKEFIYLVLECIVCYYGTNYGLNHNWLVYELVLFGFLLLFVYRCQFSFIFKLFNIKTTVSIKGIEFYNLRIQGLILILTGLSIFISVYPFTLYSKYLAIVLFGFSGGIIPLLVGLGYFFKPNTFNEYNDYSFFSSEALMWLMGGNMLFSVSFYGIGSKFPIFLKIPFLALYLLILFSILFPDVINKYNKHDIRGKDTFYVICCLVGFIVLFVLVLIFGELLGLTIH